LGRALSVYLSKRHIEYNHASNRQVLPQRNKVKEIPSTYRITDLSAEERPSERVEKKGANALSTAELLEILLRVGVEGENAVRLG